MKQVFTVLVLFVILTTSCKSEKGMKIGFLLHSSSNSRWATDIQCLNERAKEYGATVLLKDANGDENLQLKQATELLDEGADVLVVVAANQNTAGGIVRAAHERGVKVISYDKLILNSDLDYLVSFDYEKIGTLMVEYVPKVIDKGNLVILWGDPNDANALFIKKGQENALTKINSDGRFKVIYKGYVEGWDKQTAKKKCNKILDYSPDKIDAVIASNATLGIGVFESLSEHDYSPGSVFVSGMDAPIEFVRLMSKGNTTMTVVKPIKELAYGAVDLAIEILKNDVKKDNFTKSVYNGRVQVPAKLFVPYVVDKSTIDEHLVKTGTFSHDEIYK